MSLSTTILLSTCAIELCIWLAILRGVSGFYRDDSGDWFVRRAALHADLRELQMRRGGVQVKGF